MHSETPDKRTILAVDDKLENLKLLIKYLEDGGFELMVAQSGEEAFKHLERVTPDIILLDILMPGIDGFETCRRLKANEKTRDIPVIFMTALTETLDKVRGFEVGAIDYLTKPLHYEEVLARVNAHMATRKFQQQLQDKNIHLQQEIIAYNNLMQLESQAGPVIAESSAMQRLLKEIDSLSSTSGPIHITGEPGAGQVYMAKKIHEQYGNTYDPLIVVDCLRIKEGETGKFLFGSLEAEQILSHSKGFGALHLAAGGTLVLMHVGSLDIKSQRILSKYLEPSDRIEEIHKLRLITTTSRDITSTAEPNRFLPELAEQLTKNVLSMPDMLKRKRDILPLARLFLEERKQRFGEESYHLTQSAEHKLLAGQYRHRNAEELREAVDAAALFSESREIVAEHIFTGPKSEGTSLEYNLTQTRPVQWISGSKIPITILQSVILAVFAAIIALCLTSGDTLSGRIANGMVWGLWEPALIFVFLSIGRVWCTVCPLSMVGRIAQIIGSLKMNPPQWLMKNSGWLIAGAFFMVIWNEHVFHMTNHPFGTGILLLALMTGAIFFSVIFKRETWCRYLCPLGNLGAAYATASMVYVRAKPGVCAIQCSTHECFKGSALYPGCPVYHHPLYVRDGQFCKLCFSCLRSCPHGSANLYIRAPLQSIWHLGDISPTLIPLALVVFFLALVLLGVRSMEEAVMPGQFTIAALLAVSLGILFHMVLPKLLSKKAIPDRAVLSRVALTLFILGWGPFMAYHLFAIPGLSALQIKVLEESFLSQLMPFHELSVLLLIQLTVITLAALCALFIFRKIWNNFVKNELWPRKWGWRILWGICTVYLLLAIYILFK